MRSPRVAPVVDSLRRPDSQLGLYNETMLGLVFLICTYMDRCDDMLYVFFYCYLISYTYLYYREACTHASEIE